MAKLGLWRGSLVGLLLVPMVQAATSTPLLPDPTQPLSVTQPAESSSAVHSVALPILQSITYGPFVHRAVLNGRVYREGASIGQYTLLAIHADRVVLESADGTKHTLKLFSYQVRYK